MKTKVYFVIENGNIVCLFFPVFGVGVLRKLFFLMKYYFGVPVIRKILQVFVYVYFLW